MVNYFNSLSVAVAKCSGGEKATGRGKGLIWLTLPGHSLWLRAVRAGTQAGNETETLEG